MEVSFSQEIESLKLGDGDTFHGEGILAVTKALLQSGVSYVGGYQGAPVSHLLDVMVQARDYLDSQVTLTVEIGRRQVDQLEAEIYAERNSMGFFEVSPLVNFNISESFVELARMALRRNGMERLWRSNKGNSNGSLGPRAN